MISYLSLSLRIEITIPVHIMGRIVFNIQLFNLATTADRKEEVMLQGAQQQYLAPAQLLGVYPGDCWLCHACTLNLWHQFFPGHAREELLCCSCKCYPRPSLTVHLDC